MLDQINLNKEISKEDFKKQMKEMEPRIALAERRCKALGIPVIILFEGWGASGKGTLINRLIQPLDPRGFRVFTIQEPTEDEAMRPFMISRIDSLYSSNVSLNEISGTLENVRSNMLGYLNTRGSDSLNQFYKYDQDFTNLVSGLNQTTTDSEKDLLEKNIYNMSHTYIKEAEETIQAKRGRFIEQYKETYAESEETYGYISTMIMKLNNLLFANNAKSYRILQNTLNTIELLSVAVIIIVILVSITLMQ